MNKPNRWYKKVYGSIKIKKSVRRFFRKYTNQIYYVKG